MPTYILITVLAILSSSISSSRGEEAKDRITEWTETLNDIRDSCLLPKYAKTVCKYYPNRTPIKRTPVLDFCGEKAFSHGVVPLTRWAKEGIWAVSLLGAPEQTRYWEEFEISKDYKSLKLQLLRKSKKEKLLSCQRACLATCISSKIIEYEDGMPQTCIGAIQSGSGICREFSLIAADILNSLGVSASDFGGVAYEAHEGKKIPGGKHRMLRVRIGAKTYLMEPQDSSCEFYNAEFSPDTTKDGDAFEILKN